MEESYQAMCVWAVVGGNSKWDAGRTEFSADCWYRSHAAVVQTPRGVRNDGGRVVQTRQLDISSRWPAWWNSDFSGTRTPARLEVWLSALSQLQTTVVVSLYFHPTRHPKFPRIYHNLPRQGLPLAPIICQVLKLRTDVDIARPLSLADFPEARPMASAGGTSCVRLCAIRQVATARVIYSAGDIVFFCNREAMAAMAAHLLLNSQSQSGSEWHSPDTDLNRWGRSLIFCLTTSCRSWHLELETNASAELTLLFGQRNPLSL